MRSKSSSPLAMISPPAESYPYEAAGFATTLPLPRRTGRLRDGKIGTVRVACGRGAIPSPTPDEGVGDAPRVPYLRTSRDQVEADGDRPDVRQPGRHVEGLVRVGVQGV